MHKRNLKSEEKITELREHIKLQDSKLKQNELHAEKLTKQCYVMNEVKLKYEQLTKENEFMRNKLRFIEANGGMQITGSIGMSRKPPATTMQINGVNLGMEDEAGEEFNNTYLEDLKRGGSHVSLDVYSAQELQKRNSMYPQHMRSSYAINNIDRNIGEQEIKVRIIFYWKLKLDAKLFFSIFKDGGITLDDSQTALLQNGAYRKKQSTSYKRPGPPTPSKQGGRLSIGGSEVNYNHILKDSTNMDKKTPSNILKNMFGAGRVRDEVC